MLNSRLQKYPDRASEVGRMMTEFLDTSVSDGMLSPPTHWPTTEMS